MSRKYRQQGYQDKPEQSKKGQTQPRPMRDGPRSPRMPGYQEVTKCSLCGAALKLSLDDVTFSSKCTKCGSDLHCCKNCVHFDPGSRFECTQPIPERISPKDRANQCQLFEIKTTVEKITGSTSEPKSADDARQAFDDLFK